MVFDRGRNPADCHYRELTANPCEILAEKKFKNEFKNGREIIKIRPANCAMRSQLAIWLVV